MGRVPTAEEAAAIQAEAAAPRTKTVSLAPVHWPEDDEKLPPAMSTQCDLGDEKLQKVEPVISHKHRVIPKEQEKTKLTSQMKDDDDPTERLLSRMEA